MEQIIKTENKLIISVNIKGEETKIEINKDKNDIVEKIKEIASVYNNKLLGLFCIDVREINNLLIINGKEIDMGRDIEEIITIALSIMSSEFNKISIIIIKNESLVNRALNVINEFKIELIRTIDKVGVNLLKAIMPFR